MEKEQRRKNLLRLTILIVAFVQMPPNALMPSINNIVENVFRDRTLAEVQTAFASGNLVMPVLALTTAYFINRGYLTKKTALFTGLCFLGLCMVSIVLMHEHFWQLCLANILLGVAMGLFVPNAFGLMFDNFTSDERQKIVGPQTSCVNFGGILLSIFGGILGSVVWYGGFLVLAVGFPIAVMALFTVPSYRAASTEKEKKGRPKLNGRVFYYSGIVFFFMMVYNVGGSNISTHIRAGGIDNFVFLGRSISNTALAGAATAVQMAGGVFAGLFFGKLSSKLRDYALTLAFGLVFAGYLVISLFPHSVTAMFISFFFVGMAISLTMPRCVFAVSTLVDSRNSATATSLVTCLAPSLGAFSSPIVFTNLTVALGGQSTVFRYAFVGIVALILSICTAAITNVNRRTGKDLKV